MEVLYAKYKVANDNLEFKLDGKPDDATLQKIRDLRFQYAFGRKCNYGTWGPDKEDFILSLGVEIMDDDSPDNVEARVERFEGYAQDAIGNVQSSKEYSVDATTERRRKLAANRSKNEAERAEHWAMRIQGAIAHAQYKIRPDVIARRIKKYETELRSEKKSLETAEKLFNLWSNPDLTLPAAIQIANYLDHRNMEYEPGKNYSLWSILNDGLAPLEKVKEFAIKANADSIVYHRRWVEHLTDYIAYQKALLQSVDGHATDKVMLEVGGQIKVRGEWKTITKINKVTVEYLYSYYTHDPNAKWFHAKVPITDITEVRSAQDAA